VCPGGTISYTIDYRNIVGGSSNYDTSSVPAVSFAGVTTKAGSLVITADGTNGTSLGNNWATYSAGPTAIPVDSTDNTTFTYWSGSTGGTRFDAPLGHFDDLRFGLGYLNDSTGSANFALPNATGRLPGGSWSVSHATSDGTVPGIGTGTFTGTGDGGNALRFAGSTASGPYKLGFGYNVTSPQYGNPFGDLATPGLTDYHATLIRTIGGLGGDLAFTYDRENYAALSGITGASTRSNIAAILHKKLSPRFSVYGGLSLHASDTGGAAGVSEAATSPDVRASVTQADLGADWKATKSISLSVQRDQTVGGFDATQPAQTTAQASWDLNGRGRIYARELWTDSPLQLAASTGDLAPAGAATHAFTVGIEQKVDANMSVDSEYVVSRTGNGTDVNAAIGVRERLILSRKLKGDTFIQRGVGYGSASSGFAVYGLSLAYGDAGGPFRATGSLQDRTGDGGGATWSLGAAGKVAPGTPTRPTATRTMPSGRRCWGWERGSGSAASSTSGSKRAKFSHDRRAAVFIRRRLSLGRWPPIRCARQSATTSEPPPTRRWPRLPPAKAFTQR
jgi:hypothetical protein